MLPTFALIPSDKTYGVNFFHILTFMFLCVTFILYQLGGVDSWVPTSMASFIHKLQYSNHWWTCIKVYAKRIFSIDLVAYSFTSAGVKNKLAPYGMR